MKLYCDNKSTINIAHNLMQHDQTKHKGIDKHFIKEKLDSGLILYSIYSYGTSISRCANKRVVQ